LCFYPDKNFGCMSLSLKHIIDITEFALSPLNGGLIDRFHAKRAVKTI
jgi:hypothetical protein